MKRIQKICGEKMPVPVGDSNWAEFSQCCYTVDKTLLIKELIDDHTKVALFTRPRRFGKTTALKMIRAFFEKTPGNTSFLSGALKDNDHVKMGVMTGDGGREI